MSELSPISFYRGIFDQCIVSIVDGILNHQEQYHFMKSLVMITTALASEKTVKISAQAFFGTQLQIFIFESIHSTVLSLRTQQEECISNEDS